MKKVWVNRFNADGSMKPMNEWELKECFDINTHYCHFFGHFIDNASDGLSLQNDNEVSKRGMLREYIGNQRGDGWFYVFDGDLPPSQIDDSLIVNVLFEKEGILQSIPALSVHKHLKRIICWQPISQPEFFEIL